MPKPFSEHEKELFAARLLEQGYKLFSAHGLKRTNIEEIALAAGISKGAFYNFYESKEALFMAVIEQVEIRVRQELLAVVDLPGPSPRARLYAVLHKAFSLIETIPILRFISGSDFDLLFRRIPPEIFQEHLAQDMAFADELIHHCQKAGIPIQVQSEQLTSLLYPLVLTAINEGDLGRNNFGGSMNLLLELVAAFCLGEIQSQLPPQFTAAGSPE